MRRASTLLSGTDLSAEGIARQWYRIRRYQETEMNNGPWLFTALPVADTPGRDLRIARRLATFRRLASVHAAGEAVDQPHIVIGDAFHADKPRADSCDQRRQQDSGSDEACADQNRHRGSRAIRREWAMPLIFVWS